MGWTCYHTPPSSEKAEIEGLVTFVNEDRAMRPIYTTRKGNVWYMAVEVTAKIPNADPYGYEADSLGRYVFAAVVLTSRNGGEWCYKDMEESMGPCEAQAPKKLLDMLSPTTKEYALSWRERCKAAAALTGRTVAHGDTIQLAQPLTFNDGVERDTFTVQKKCFSGNRRATTYFLCQKTGVQVSISKFMHRTWVKVPDIQQQPKSGVNA